MMFFVLSIVEGHIIKSLSLGLFEARHKDAPS